MINIDDIKSAIKSIKDAEITESMDEEKNRYVKIKKGKELFHINLMEGDERNKFKIRLVKAIKTKIIDKSIMPDEDIIETKLNLNSETPCRVAYSKIDENYGVYIIQTFYSDKLDSFENNLHKLEKLKLLLLEMMIDLLVFAQEITELRSEYLSRNNPREGSEHEK